MNNRANNVTVQQKSIWSGILSLPVMLVVSLVLAILKLSGVWSISWFVVALPVIVWVGFIVALLLITRIVLLGFVVFAGICLLFALLTGQLK